jgi:hypothetical protein
MSLAPNCSDVNIYILKYADMKWYNISNWFHKKLKQQKISSKFEKELMCKAFM